MWHGRESKYQILEIIKDGVVVLDHELNILYANDVAFKLIPLKDKDIGGRNITEIFPNVEETPVYKYFVKNKSNRINIDFDVYSSELDAYFQISVYPIEEGYSLLFKDVSDIKKITMELRKHESNLTALVSSLDDIVLEINESYQCLNIWTAQSNVNYLMPKGFIGRNILDLVSEDKRSIVELALKRLFQKGQPQTVEFSLKHNPKKIIFAKMNMIKSHQDSKRASVFIRDITDVKETEHEFDRVRQLLELITHSRQIGILEYSFKTNTFYWDKGYSAIYGLPHHKTRPYFWREYVFPEDLLKTQRKMEEGIKNGSGYSVEYRIQTKNGVRHIRSVCVYERDTEDRPLKIIGVNWDITEEVRAQAELEERRASSIQTSKLAALGQMSASIAHEINNPLAIIQARSEYLYDAVSNGCSKPEVLADNLRSILSTSRRISKIIRGLRAFVRDSKADPFEVVLLESFIEDMLALCRAQCHHYNIQITWINTTKDLTFECRSSQILQVLLNLVNNAIDALREAEEKWIKIFTEEKEDKLVISVEDSGGGISEELQERIWEPFFTTKKPQHGTGLGLWIVKGILENHNGTIYLDPHSQHTRFVVTLPKRQNKSSPAPTNSSEGLDFSGP